MDNFRFERLSDKIEICISEEHRFGTDAFLLTYFTQYKKNDLVCDLGTGCGIIPLLMARHHPPKKIYAIDIQKQAIEQLSLSLNKSKIDYIEPICADLKDLWDGASVGQFSLVTCNPPYKAYNAGIESEMTAQRIARHEILCDINDVCKASSRLLKYGGRLCICNRPERLGDVIFAMKQNDIEPKRLRFVCKNPDSPAWLFLIEGKKGSKPFMKVEPQFYTQGENGYSEELNKIYGMRE